MEISVRDFRANMSKIMEENKEVKVTSKGKVVYTVFRGNVDKPIQTKKEAEKAVAKLVKETPGVLYGKYSCGCDRTTKKLCPKHGRL